MAVVARIKLVQGVNTPPAGQALDGVTGSLVTASNENNANVVSYEWQLVDVPPGSSLIVAVKSTGSTYSFTPDVAGGCYLVQLTVYDKNGKSATTYLAVVVKNAYGRAIPPFSGTAAMLNIGGTLRGYSPLLESYLKVLDRLGDVGGSAPTSGQVPKWNSGTSRYEPGSAGGPSLPALLGASTTHRWLFNDAANSNTVVDDVGGANLTVQNGGNVVQGDTGLYCDSCSFTSNGFARSTVTTNPSSTTLLTLHGWFKDRAFTNSFARLIGKGFVPMTSYSGTGGFNSVEIVRNGTTGTIYAIWVAQTNTTKSTTQRSATGRYIVALNMWHYLAVTFSQAAGNMTVNIYLDGNLLSSEIVASAAIDWNGASAGGWCMGAVANAPVGTASHDGWVFDWRVEDGVAMNQTQVRAHYKAGQGYQY